MKLVKIYLLTVYFEPVFVPKLNILGPTNDFVLALCVSYNTPMHVCDPPETVTYTVINNFLSIYNQKYAKKHSILQSRVLVYERIRFSLCEYLEK